MTITKPDADSKDRWALLVRRAFGCRRLFRLLWRLFLFACIALGLVCSLQLALYTPEFQRHIDNYVKLPVITPAPASKESDHIAFICKGSGRNPLGAIYTIRPDGSHLRQIHAGTDVLYSYLAWSPDGIWLSVVVRNYQFISSVTLDENAEVYRLRFDGLDTRRLTYNRVEEFAPRWSNDGKSIAFLSREGIHRISDKGDEISRYHRANMATSSYFVRPVDWSSDEQMIIVGSAYDDIFYGRNPDGSDLQALTSPGEELADVAWAANNEQILFYNFQTRLYSM